MSASVVSRATGQLDQMTTEQIVAFRPEVMVVPIGSTEPHGPHLPYGTDTIITEGVAREAVHQANQQGVEILLLPTLPISNNVNFKEFPFACRIRVSTLLAILRDLADFAIEEGVKKLVFINIHGGNDSTLRAGLREIYDSCADRLFVCFCGPSAFQNGLYQELFKDHSPHAGDYETSMVQYLAPELTRMSKAESEPMEKPVVMGLNNPAIHWVKPWHELMPRSFAGDPHLASREKGEKYFQTCSQGMAQFLVELSRSPWGPGFPYTK